MKVPSVMLLLLGLTLVVGQDEYMDEIPWTYTVEDGKDAMLICNDSKPDFMTEPGDQLKWMRNDMEVKEGTKWAFTERHGIKKFYLIIKDLQPADYGIYHCYVHDNQMMKKFQIQKGVNLSGPLYAELFDRYRENLIIGVISAGVLLSLLLLCCFVYHFRYREENDEKTYNLQTDDYFDKTRFMPGNVFDNTADVSDDDGNHGTKEDTDMPHYKTGTVFDNPAVSYDEDDHVTKGDMEMVKQQSGANGYGYDEDIHRM